jgi:hypothetical protein
MFGFPDAYINTEVMVNETFSLTVCINAKRVAARGGTRRVHLGHTSEGLTKNTTPPWGPLGQPMNKVWRASWTI